MLSSLEPNVGLTSNQAVNWSLSVVSRSKKKDWPNRTMKGPWRALSVQGSLHILHFLWHRPNENSYWLYFCILCNKNGIKGLWGHKGPPSLGPGPALVLQWTLPWPYNTPNMVFIHWLYFCILCNKIGIRGLWGHKGPPSLGLGPALVLQWTLPWPYNTPNMALYILAIFLQAKIFECSTVQPS